MWLTNLYRRRVPRKVHHVLRGTTGSVRARVENAIDLKGLPVNRTRPGSVWGVTMMKNEADVAPWTVRHFFAQGLDGIIVIDNLSSDGTSEAIRDTMAAGRRLYVGIDSEPAYFQSEKISYICHLAWRAGADWIVPFDADEHWYAPNQLLAEYIRPQSAQILRALMHDVVPVGRQAVGFGPGERVGVRRSKAIVASPDNFKVAFRAAGGTHVLTGNHDIARAGVRMSGLHLLHYQWRNEEQFIRKVRQGAQAAELAELGAGLATHWREMALLSDEELRAAWHRICETLADDSSMEWAVASSPWFGWGSWDPGSTVDGVQ